MRHDVVHKSMLWRVAKVVLTACGILVGFPIASCLAQEETAEPESVNKPMQGAYDELAKQFEFRLKDGQLLKLNPKPLLNYTNPIRSRGQSGAVYLWTHAGSPTVIGSLWSIRDESDPNSRRLSVEFPFPGKNPKTSFRAKQLY